MSNTKESPPTRTSIFIVMIVAIALALSASFGLPSCSKGTKEKPVSLPEDAQRNVTMTAFPSSGFFKAEIYNGSEWTLTSLDVEIFTTAGNKPRETRRIRLIPAASTPESSKLPAEQVIKPYSTVQLQAAVGSFLDEVKGKEDWGFSLSDARGYRD